MLTLKSKGTIPNIPEYLFIADDEDGTIVYHADLLGNGEQFAPTTNLIPKYIPHRLNS